MRLMFVSVVSALLASLSVPASGFGSNDAHHQNFFIGGELAYAIQKEDFTTRFSSPLTFPPTTIGFHSETIEDKGILFGLVAGWQYRLCRVMLGIEGNVDFQNFNILRSFQFGSPSDIQYAGTAYYERGPTYALTGRVGYFVTPGFLPYLRLGAQVSRDEANYQVFAVPTLPTGLGSDFSSKTKVVFGVVAAAGVELPTYIGGSTIRFEYTFTRSDRIQIEDTTLPILGTHKFHYPQTGEFKVVWLWNFC